MAEGHPSLVLPLCVTQLQVEHSPGQTGPFTDTTGQVAPAQLTALCQHNLPNRSSFSLLSVFGGGILLHFETAQTNLCHAETVVSHWRGRILMGMLLQLFQHNKARLLECEEIVLVRGIGPTWIKPITCNIFLHLSRTTALPAMERVNRRVKGWVVVFLFKSQTDHFHGCQSTNLFPDITLLLSA